MKTVTDELRPEQMSGAGLTGQRKSLAVRDVWSARKAITAYALDPIPGPPESRRAQILALPRKDWHGRIVFAVTCEDCGKERWVSEAVLWSVVSLEHFACQWCMLHGPAGA